MTRPMDADDLAAYATDDALLDAIAAGVSWGVPSEATRDEVADLLGSWRRELDDAIPVDEDVVPASRTSWRSRARRHTAAAAAVVVTLAASTGVAAAASGTHGPLAGLHRVLFGASPAPAHRDGVAAEVASMLDAISARIDAAQATGGVTQAQRAALSGRLDSAQRLLSGDVTATETLSQRLTQLRGALAALDTLPSATPGLPPVHLAQPPSDGHGGSDDGSGSGDVSRDGSGSQSGDGSGDGSSTGSDGSGDGGSTGDGSSTGSDGSGDGGTGGDGSTSGDTSGDGSTSGDTSGDTGGDTGTSDGGSGDGGSSGGTSDGGSIDG
jgi:hypothetical protein